MFLMLPRLFIICTSLAFLYTTLQYILVLHRGQKKPRTENRDRDRESGPRTETEAESQKNREIRDRKFFVFLHKIF